MPNPLRPPKWSDMETVVGGSGAAVRSPSSTGSSSDFQPVIPVLQPGTLLARRYEILQILGEGGMGAVFKAHDLELDRVVALKIIRPDLAGSAAMVQRFKQELILAREVTHRNIVRLYDIGEDSGLKFITMEYIEGEDLCGLLAEHGKFTPEESVEVIRQVCEALEAAHDRGVIHRDLKPHNIMLDKQDRIVVMDFGLARALEPSGMTQAGALVGTMEYMSPEQALGESVDARSDLFNVGLIFYELLTSKMPYSAPSALASLLKRTRERAQPPSDVDSAVPRPLSNIVSKCLECRREDRYQSAGEIIHDLNSQRVARRVSLPRFRIPARILSPWKLAAVAALVALLAVGAWLWHARVPSRAPAHQASVSVLVADFINQTGDPIFDGTLEPMFNVALEGASFINAFSRGDARKLAGKLAHPTDKLDEQSARLIAVSQGLGAVVTGSLSRRGDGYRLSVGAMDVITGDTLANADVNASTKDEVLLAIPRLVVPIRNALGDTRPASAQLAAAGGTFTAASLEAAHLYGLAMEQQFAGKMEQALESFSKAAELDPNFARAYAGMAGTSRNLGRRQDAERYFKLAMEHVDRMTERERYRTRGAYYVTIGNFQKCVEEYGALVSQYPADNIGHNNLAVCYSELRNMPKAVEEAQRAVEISPKGAMQRMNFSLYASYAGDFRIGEREARAVQQLNPSYEKGYLTLAYAQLGQGQLPQAAETYRKLEKLSSAGASMAASGLANLALYGGRFSDAVRILENGAAADLAARNSEHAAEKFVALAYTQLLRGQKKPALDAAERALANSKKVNIRFLAGRIFAAAGEPARARALAQALASELHPDPQAHAKLIEGEIALEGKDARKAIQVFTEANNLLDTWIGRFDLGRAYLEAGLFTEADSEFDRCFKRRGEALELVDGPTYGYFPPLYYYQGRVREGLKSSGAAESYRTYLRIRGKAGEDPLLPEVRRRLGQ